MPGESHHRGYRPKDVSPSISTAGPVARAAAVAESVGSHDLTSSPRRVVDQRDTSCCVSCALGAAMEIIHPSWPPLAPLFHYYVTRYRNHEGDEHGSISIDAGLSTLIADGICRHVDHAVSFAVSELSQPPNAAAYADAHNRRLLRKPWFFQYREHREGSRVVWVRDQIRQECPVVVGFMLPICPDAFLDRNNEWADPDRFVPSDTGHCVLLLGYNDARSAFRIQDSRGTTRFQSGCWWMGYRVAESHFVRELYALVP